MRVALLQSAEEVVCLLGWCLAPAASSARTVSSFVTLSSVVAGKCIDCGVTPEPEACHCWQDASWSCSACDAGNLPINASSCTDF